MGSMLEGLGSLRSLLTEQWHSTRCCGGVEGLSMRMVRSSNTMLSGPVKGSCKYPVNYLSKGKSGRETIYSQPLFQEPKDGILKGTEVGDGEVSHV